jgi:hypothetical protein
MKKKLLAVLVAGMLMLGMAGAASATTIFSDNFESDSIGLSKSYLNNWSVSNGNVDLIGAGSSWSFFPLSTHGKYVDMDGSMSDAGLMISLSTFNLSAGDYVLSFDLAGNQRLEQTDSVTVKVNEGISSSEYSLAAFAPFYTYTQSFSLLSPTYVTLSFEGTGGDNVGMLLDNVLLTKVETAPVPEPGTIALLGLGMVGLAFYSKRHKNSKA